MAGILKFFMEIINAPQLILNQKAKPVTKIDPQILNLIEEMKKTLLLASDPKGVGLAAPQVGKSFRLFITKPSQKSPFLVFVNPEIIKLFQEKPEKLGKREQKLEGCLSIPNIWGHVQRAKKVKLRYQLITPNSDLITKTRVFSGFLATIIQHEMDHIEGILFTQRVLEQKEKLFKLVKDKKGKDHFQELIV